MFLFLKKNAYLKKKEKGIFSKEKGFFLKKKAFFLKKKAFFLKKRTIISKEKHNVPLHIMVITGNHCPIHGLMHVLKCMLLSFKLAQWHL